MSFVVDVAELGAGGLAGAALGAAPLSDDPVVEVDAEDGVGEGSLPPLDFFE